ncbi:MAG: site-specific integrase, partial [Eubacteriales bacterium]|nr:site-specific integrase [Eubacteriales bacterium]
MSVYKDENTGTWRVVFRYKDWNGENKQTQKRGFQTKREAIKWECEQKAIVNVDLNMKFGSFVDLYYEDMKSRIRLSTLKNKEQLISKKILPYFKNRKINSITPRDIVKWQNVMMDYRNEDGKPYTPTYLKTINNQISAIFNHAVNFYGLKENPVRKAGSMGKKEADEMLFWTTEEYEKFAEEVMDNPRTYYAFELLYWCGIREGELLALTPKDFDFEHNKLSITKSYQRIEGQDIITPPKTQKGIRVIDMPEFLAGEMQDYM